MFPDITLLRSINNFNLTKQQANGGKTGSIRVSSTLDESEFYQLKFPIHLQSITRQLRTQGTDRENFGEFIAALIAKNLAKNILVPEISLVFDPEQQSVFIASKYFTGQSVKTLDEYAQEHGVLFSEASRHLRCIAGEVNKPNLGDLAIDGAILGPLKDQLTSALVLSALIGDHDVNPGNLVIINDENKTLRVARIDFGHAFNDLLNAPSYFGGQLIDKENPILDFLNRPVIAHFLPGGSTSKLHRDYPGIVPSQELVDKLRSYSEGFEAAIDEAIRDAHHHFVHLLELIDSTQNQTTIKHIKLSLYEIYKNICIKTPTTSSQRTVPRESNDSIFSQISSRLKFFVDSSIKTLTTNDTDTLLTEDPEFLTMIFSKLGEFVKTNCKNLKPVSNIMQLQVDIDNALLNGAALPQRFTEILSEHNFPLKDGMIQWVVTNHAEPAFSGRIIDYISYRKDQIIQQLSQENPRKIKSEEIYCRYDAILSCSQFKDEEPQYPIATPLSFIKLPSFC